VKPLWDLAAIARELRDTVAFHGVGQAIPTNPQRQKEKP
jgi:hypothetical protein